VNTAVCDECYGEGTVVKEPCPDCRGVGYQKHKRHISVKIPAGIDDGNGIRLSGEGNAGSRGGPAGNLYVIVTVKKHEYYTREGDNIITNLPINFAQAALGAEVEVPTLYGPAVLKIPSGSQTGKIFRLKDKGVPRLHGSGKGDQMVIIRVMTPESLNREQRRLFEELAKSLGQAK
jgi:molecular chaperone DnaJ